MVSGSCAGTESDPDAIAPDRHSCVRSSAQDTCQVQRRLVGTGRSYRIAIDLAARSTRDCFHDPPAARQLGFREVCLHPLVQGAQSSVVMPGQHHSHPYGLPVYGVVESERANVARIFKAFYDRVDIRRVNLHAAFIDLVALPSAQNQPAPVVEKTNIAGHEPAIDDSLRSEVVALEITLHQCRRIQPDETGFSACALGVRVKRDGRVRRMQYLDDCPPTFADQPILRGAIRIAESGHPTSGLGDAVRIADLPGAAPGADILPYMRRQRRR